MQSLKHLLPLILIPSTATLAKGPETVEDKLAAAKAAVTDISTDELAVLIEDKADVVVVDVRTRRETWLVGGYIDAPRHLEIPRGWLEFRIADEVPKHDTPIVVYCGITI